MSEYAVQLKNITKTFGSVVANNRVDLNVRRGEILALLGEKYAPSLIRPYDMFPRTFHVETLVLLCRK